jgi:hypothetical protein
MRFAKYTFLIAGIYGLLVLVPMYFLEEKNGRDFPPPINHPEYYYGFVGVAVAWQVVFLVLSTNPKRYRPMMLPAILEKLGFAVPVMVLLVQDRVPFFIMVVAIPDLILGALFAVSFVKTRHDESAAFQS